MSIFDKFLEISPLTFKLTKKLSTKATLNPKKHVLYEGELNIKSKNGAISINYFKIVDRKLVCSTVKI